MGKIHVNTNRRVCLAGLYPEELTSKLAAFMSDRKQKPYRVNQIIGWMYRQGEIDFAGMDNLPRELREDLSREYTVLSLRCAQQIRADDRTEKFLWITEDGYAIESVFMPSRQKATLCLSTQVGCPLGCSFCATGELGLVRNLRDHEIVSQVLGMKANTSWDHNLSNVVFMGMGEPLLNYEQIARVIRIINDPNLLQIGARRITVSTAGIPAGIRRLATDFPQVKLAVSLNAPIDSLRDKLMPINRRFPLRKVIEAVKFFTGETGKRITFEYIIIPGVNDSRPIAHSLRKLIAGIPCKVNLIALNRPGPGNFRAPNAQEVKRFRELLMDILPQSVTLRKSMGGQIRAACGQLAATGREVM